MNYGETMKSGLFLLLGVALVYSLSPLQAQSSGNCSSGSGGGGTCYRGGFVPPVGTLSPSRGVYPAFGIPQPVGGGLFSVQAGQCSVNVWKAPSGYYYPYCGVPPGWNVYHIPMPILMNPQYSPPSAAEPPVSTFISDTNEFLDKSKKEKKLSERDYKNLSQRLKDLGSKEKYLRNQAGGSMDKQDEDQMRQEVAQVLKEMQWRLGRNEKY